MEKEYAFPNPHVAQLFVEANATLRAMMINPAALK
jgi:hypothetical protein|tara:strand:- start:61 stop:165 length:105 start_codon:yes stop_codon:yes gene_type:complete